MSEHLADTNVGNIEYISKQYAVNAINDALKRVFTEHVGEGIINPLKPADVIPVVRCKDCRYFWKFLRECERSGALTMYPLHDTDFCSYGERREE